MLSYFSNWLIGPEGFVSAVVRVTGAGKAFPVLSSVTAGEAISVNDGLFGSVLGINSLTVPVTATRFPATATEGGALEVKTKIPSEVLGSESAAASGACMKNPLLLTPVTIPVVETSAATNGEVSPLP